MELEHSLSNTSKKVIRIKNGSSTIETGLLSTDLTQVSLSILIKEMIEELSSPNQMDLRDKLLITTPLTIK